MKSGATMVKKKAGRPKKVIDYDVVEKLARFHCTQDEIASFLGVSTRTLLRNAQFCHLYKKGLENGKMTLRRAQFHKAIKDKDTTMQIWLGKILLGQKEPRDNDINVHSNIVLDADDIKMFDTSILKDQRVVVQDRKES